MVAGRKHCHLGEDLFLLSAQHYQVGENESETLRELGQDCNSRSYLCLSVFSSHLGSGSGNT